MSYGEEEDVYLGRPVMPNHEASMSVVYGGGYMHVIWGGGGCIHIYHKSRETERPRIIPQLLLAALIFNPSYTHTYKLYIYMYVYVCIHTSIHIYIHTYIYTYIHIYIHTHAHTFSSTKRRAP